MPQKTMILAATLPLLVAAFGGGEALATKQCRDATGKFIYPVSHRRRHTR